MSHRLFVSGIGPSRDHNAHVATRIPTSKCCAAVAVFDLVGRCIANTKDIQASISIGVAPIQLHQVPGIPVAVGGEGVRAFLLSKCSPAIASASGLSRRALLKGNDLRSCANDTTVTRIVRRGSRIARLRRDVWQDPMWRVVCSDDF